MTGTRKLCSAAFKARVALEVAKQTRTLAELSGECFRSTPSRSANGRSNSWTGLSPCSATGAVATKTRARRSGPTCTIADRPAQEVSALSQHRLLARVGPTHRSIEHAIGRIGRCNRSSSWGMNRQSYLDDQFVSFAAKADCDEGLGYL
jgi:hypothetical protein